jgi:ABC-type glycerol-3-phosphate transport system permease component
LPQQIAAMRRVRLSDSLGPAQTRKKIKVVRAALSIILAARVHIFPLALGILLGFAICVPANRDPAAAFAPFAVGRLLLPATMTAVVNFILIGHLNAPLKPG